MSAGVRYLEKIFKFFSSIQLAIIIIISLGIISAVGTIVEARYDATYAQKLVYGSPYMYLIMGLLCVNLINVMIDRWPWKPYHAGFVCAHVGIIILIAGSLMTKIYGVDGSMSFDIGQSNRYVMLPDTEFVVYSAFGDGNYKHMYSNRQDYLLQPPQQYPD
ncbi:MAG: cytochrome c biogenesis protein, partial [Bdellovibrionales bacterium]|nr:cytochrome c biogenesis protein [Bdellovibrionales bacterium]